MFDILAQAEAAKTVSWTLEIVKLALPAIFGFLAVWLGLLIWHLKKRGEPRYESLGYLSQKRLDGLLMAWSLLAYITEVENPKAVKLWKKNGGKTVHYLRPQQAKEYIAALSEMFYNGGYGLLLGRKVKELFYEYRGHLYGVLLKAKSGQGGSDRIELTDKLSKRMKEIYNELNAELRKELKKIEK